MTDTIISSVNLDQRTYSHDEEVNRWAKEYYLAKESYYKEQLDRVVEISEIDDEILEIGSAPFQFTFLLENQGFNVTGVDLDPSRFSPFIEEYDIDVRQCDIEQETLPFEDESFDIIILAEVLEHLRLNPIRTLEEIRRVLSSEGSLYLTTPNQYRLPAIWDFLQGNGLLSNAYGEFEKLDRVGHMGHVREYAPSEVRELLRETGYTIEDVDYSNFGSKPTSLLSKGAHRFMEILPQTKKKQIVLARK